MANRIFFRFFNENMEQIGNVFESVCVASLNNYIPKWCKYIEWDLNQMDSRECGGLFVNPDTKEQEISKENQEIYLTQISKLFFFREWINPKEIASSGKVLFDISKMTGFEFYSVLVAIRSLYENWLCYKNHFNFQEFEKLETPDEIGYFWISFCSKFSEKSYSLTGNHAFWWFTFLKPPTTEQLKVYRWNRLKVIPEQPPLNIGRRWNYCKNGSCYDCQTFYVSKNTE